MRKVLARGSHKHCPQMAAPVTQSLLPGVNGRAGEGGMQGGGWHGRCILTTSSWPTEAALLLPGSAVPPLEAA